MALARAELQLLAVGKLVNPHDAVCFLDLDELTNANGHLDPELAIKAIAELVGQKPYIAVPVAGSRPTFRGRS